PESVHLWRPPFQRGRGPFPSRRCGWTKRRVRQDEGQTQMEKIRVEKEIGGRTLSLETGVLAKLTAGSVLVQYGDTTVLCAVARSDPREGIDFFPLQVEYRERRSAAGKFPGGFMKREGRPTNKEVLSMRLVDRACRPLFPDGFKD